MDFNGLYNDHIMVLAVVRQSVVRSEDNTAYNRRVCCCIGVFSNSMILKLPKIVHGVYK